MSTCKDYSMSAEINTIRTFSMIMSAALEYIGYSYTAIIQRQIENVNRTHHTYFTVGSKGEGIALDRESDHDYLLVRDDCICANNIGDIDDHYPDHQLLLVAEMDSLNPGYAYVKVPLADDVLKLHANYELLQSCFKFKEGDVYLSSTLYKDSVDEIYFGHRLVPTQIHGPSQQINVTGKAYDMVLAITYKCSVLMQEWLSRPRSHGWPSADTLRLLEVQDWHLVPVGPQNADDSNHLWRICFTVGELYLVKTFNITQLHLLILLKQVMNKTLKPLCSAFSSYTAKNLVFWMAEILAPENFNVENLSSLLMMSLQMLRHAVENEKLQNYMIPSRNLLKDKIDSTVKIKVIQLLDMFLDDGPCFILNRSEFSELQAAMQKEKDARRSNKKTTTPKTVI